MISLKQNELNEWHKKNFDVLNTHEQLIGMTEEVGEIAHYYLKGQQGIRGVTREVMIAKMVDGWCDTVIFGIQMMTSLNVDAEKALEMVIEQVLQRDWRKDKEGNTVSQHKE